MQANYDLATCLSSDDTHANYIPVYFDDYLVQAKMHHHGSRPNTNSKLQSDYNGSLM